MDASFLISSRLRWIRVALVTVVFGLAVSGCSGCKKDQIADDPTLDTTGLEDLRDDSPGDRSFEGDENVPFDRDTPSADDVDPNALPPQLQDVFFGYDQYELDSESRSVLQADARLLRESKWTLLVEGHCDERGTAQYNMALGWKRANEVQRYLVSLGIDAGRLETVSYGKERPFVTGSGEDVWAQNRRAHLKIQDMGR